MAINWETIEQAAIDNADYRSSTSLTKCDAFIAALEKLRLRPTATGTREANVSFSPEACTAAIKTAEEWRQANAAALSSSAATSSPSVVYADLRNSRC